MNAQRKWRSRESQFSAQQSVSGAESRVSSSKSDQQWSGHLVGFVVSKGTSNSTHQDGVYDDQDNGRRESAEGQATKGTRWMPRHQEAMKDVETCEKLRGAGLERRSVDLRIGKPGERHGSSSCTEYIGV